MKKNYRLLVILTLVLTTYNCTTTSLNTTNSNFDYKVNNNRNSRIINGYVQTSAFNVKSLSSDIKKYQISLSNTANNNLKNKVVSTGLSDKDGFFFIITENNFSPQLGEIYLLEATTRNSIKNNISFKTYVKWNGKNYEGIIKNKLLINSTTTAISIISDSKNIDINKIIGKLTINDNKITLDEITEEIDINLINQVKDLVEQSILSGYDPISSIKYNNNKFYLLLNDKIPFLSGCSGECKDKIFIPSPKKEKIVDNTTIAEGYKEAEDILSGEERIIYLTNYGINSIKNDNTDMKTISYDLGYPIKTVDNGSKITYYFDGKIFSINIDGSNKELLFEENPQENITFRYFNSFVGGSYMYSIHNDLDKILAIKQEQNGDNNLILLDKNNNYIYISQNSNIKYPINFSEDGKKILFLEDNGLSKDIYVFNLENNAINKIYSIDNDKYKSLKSINNIIWFHDSIRILVCLDKYALNYPNIYNVFQEKYLDVIDLQGNITTNLFRGTQYVSSFYYPSISNDDKLIAFSSGSELAIMNYPMNNLKLINKYDGAYNIKWSKDNKTLLVNGNSNLYSINIDGKNKIDIPFSYDGDWINKYNGNEIFPTPTPEPTIDPNPNI